MRSRKEWPAAAPFALPADARLDSSSACPMPRSGASAASEDDLDETELWGDDGPAPCAEAAPPTRTTPRGHSRSPSPSLSLSDADRDDAGRPSTDSLAPLRGAPMAIVGSASPSRAGGALGRRRPVAASLPARACPLGTSLPVRIPGAAMARGEGRGGAIYAAEAAGPRVGAATFVPPHLLHAAMAGSGSGGLLLAGESPAASVKRDRLLQRTAVLRSTGFLEPTAAPLPHAVVSQFDGLARAASAAAAGGRLPAAAVAAAASPRPAPPRPVAPGALSAALGTPPVADGGGG